MRIYHPSSSTFTTFDKTLGKQLTPATIAQHGFALFFSALDAWPRRRARVLRLVREKVREVAVELSKVQSRVRMYSSSLLLVYEGDVGGSGGEVDVDLEDDSTDMNGSSSVTVKLIDFAHSYVLGEDETVAEDREPMSLPAADGVLTGLHHLLAILDQLLLDQTQQ